MQNLAALGVGDIRRCAFAKAHEHSGFFFDISHAESGLVTIRQLGSCQRFDHSIRVNFCNARELFQQTALFHFKLRPAVHVLQTATAAHFVDTANRLNPIGGSFKNFNRPAFCDFRSQARISEQHPFTRKRLVDENRAAIDVRDTPAFIRQ